MALPLERIEGKYEIVAKIREGGMGALYRVRHRLLDEIRVVKVLRSQLDDPGELRARFAEEARAAIKLRHPNVVQIFDFTLDDDGVGLIVMEHIDGVDLGQLIGSRTVPSLALTLEIARQALRALGYLHQRGFVHRDVSPDNLMLTTDVDGKPLVKIIDLGIAKHTERAQELTSKGVFLGKFRYASPEHFGEGGDEIEPRSDLYSFGIVLYELLTGARPITGNDASALIAGHLFRPSRPFSQTDPQGRVPKMLRSAVRRAIEKRPEDRFRDAAAFAEMLASVQRHYALDHRAHRELAQLLRPTAETPAPPPPGSTQHRLDAGFDLSLTPSPRADLHEAAAEAAEDQARLKAARDALSAAKERSEAILSATETVQALIAEDQLIEADVALFQAAEAHGPSGRLSALRQRLDDVHHRKSEGRVVQAERTILRAIQQRKLEVAEQMLVAAEGRFGLVDPFDSLRQILERTVNEDQDGDRGKRPIRDTDDA